MWKCNQCGENVDNSFEICWNCGTTRDGVVDPHFRREADQNVSPVRIKPSRSCVWKRVAVVITVFVICSGTYWWSLEPLEQEILRLKWGTDEMKRSGPARLAELVVESDDPLPALTEALRRYSNFPTLLEFSRHLTQRAWNDDRAIPALKALLDDEEDVVRTAAARMLLGLYGGESYQFQPSELPILIQILEGELSTRYPQQLEPVLQELSRLGPAARPAIPILVQKMHSQPYGAAQSINSVLASIGPTNDYWMSAAETETTVAMLVDLLECDYYRQIRHGRQVYAFGDFSRQQYPYFNAPVTLLVEIGPAAVPAVMASLDHHNFRVREKAALILGLIGSNSDETVPALIRLLTEDPHPRVRRSAAQALGEIGPDALNAVPALVEALEDQTDESGFLDILPWSRLHNDPWSIPSIARAALSRIDPMQYGNLDKE